MKIEESDFSATGKDDDRHTIGTARIEFSDGQVGTFDDIREDMFENWVESEYDPDLVPVDMQDAWRPWAAAPFQNFLAENRDQNPQFSYWNSAETEKKLKTQDLQTYSSNPNIPSPLF